MNRKYIFLTALIVPLFMIVGCSMLSNPFEGKWNSPVFNLEFRSDKTFDLSLGNNLSINLKGTYEYDKKSLTMALDGHADMVFSYEFKNSKKNLVLIPESDDSYINTRIEFTRE
ncbi:MAG: hypothetical protein AAF462_03125 [Thermodesulfobacteriota bacterium]